MALAARLAGGRVDSSDGLALAGYTFQVLRSANPTRGLRGVALEDVIGPPHGPALCILERGNGRR
jgi:hypothetical protein